MPNIVKLSKTQPAFVTKVPSDLKNPMYGVIGLAGKAFAVLVDGSRLIVDTNADGDLTDDAPADWKPMGTGDGGVSRGDAGTMQVQIGLGDGKTPVTLGVYRFNPNHLPSDKLKDTILYYSDYALDGEAVLGDKTYHVMLSDMGARGTFDPAADAKTPDGEERRPIQFMIDVNGNGRFDRTGEEYDLGKPFNIGGTTYELQGFSPSGEGLKIVKSAEKVAEILPPADLSAGHMAIPFTGMLLDGKPLAFPTAYKGKVVMLDFWATWCGPCMGEVPNIVKVYNQTHGQGFEILGISLDDADTFKNIAPVTKDKGMTWNQIADKQGWKAAIAQKYFIDSIPHAFLVDGDTGLILAEGDAIRGDNLLPAVQKALADKAKGKSK